MFDFLHVPSVVVAIALFCYYQARFGDVGENVEAVTFWHHDKLLGAEESKNEGSESEN